MKTPEVVRVREREKFSYSCLGAGGAEKLKKAVRDIRRGVFDFYWDYAQAKQYVGLVSAGSHTVEILPKVYEEDDTNLGYLLALLRYTRNLPVHQGEVAQLATSGGSFLEAWIRHFAVELNRLLRTQYKQRYVEVEERSGFIRGKLLTERELDGRHRLSARYACRYELFTPDHLLNRTLRYCNLLLLKQTGSSKNRRLLSENDALMADVSPTPVRAEEAERIRIDRLSNGYESILDLCKLLLKNSTLDLRTGRSPSSPSSLTWRPCSSSSSPNS